MSRLSLDAVHLSSDASANARSASRVFSIWGKEVV